MTTEGKRIAIGVFCADWRLHQDSVHLNKAVCDYLEVDGTDVISIPGPDGVCAVHRFEQRREVLADDLRTLIGAHNPVAIAFLSHQSCAGHPVSNDEHAAHTEQMMLHYRDELGFMGEMVALCLVHEADDKWPLKEVARIPAETDKELQTA